MARGQYGHQGHFAPDLRETAWVTDPGESSAMNDSRAAEATVTRRIEFGETDASGRYHFSTALKLFEAAECELLLRLGLIDTIYTSMPRAGLTVNYRAVLRFMDEVGVTCFVAGLGRTSVTFGFEVRRGDELCVDGTITAVYVDQDGRPQPWAEDHRQLLAPA